MPNTTKPVCPFYDQEPGAPPPFPPMLTDQLELFRNTHHPTILICDEILPPKASTIIPPIVHALEGKPVSKLAVLPSKNTIRFSSPYPKRASPERFPSQSPIPSDSDSIDSVSDSGSSTSSASPSEDSKIPKPPGEPGRPGRGGYTLQESLNWSPKAYMKFKKCMHHLIEEHLDTTKCASSQSPALLKCVRDKAVDAFTDLDNYSRCWPVNDMIMMRLKYTSGRARKMEVGMAAGKSRNKK